MKHVLKGGPAFKAAFIGLSQQIGCQDYPARLTKGVELFIQQNECGGTMFPLNTQLYAREIKRKIKKKIFAVKRQDESSPYQLS